MSIRRNHAPGGSTQGIGSDAPLQSSRQLACSASVWCALPIACTQSSCTASVWRAGSFQSCVIARESGGNSQVMNASGHYGLYQFSYSAWVAAGGSGADFGHASAAEQNQVFDTAYAQDGTSPWAPYDGC